MNSAVTWNSSTNCIQTKEVIVYLSKLIPMIIDAVMDNSNQLWGSENYQLVGQR